MSERSGIHLTGADSGWPVSSDREADPHKRGDGLDRAPRAKLIVNGLTTEDSRPLWSPPAQSNPTVVTLGTGFSSNTFAANEDAIVHLPASLKTSQTIISGGRHVRIIGGKQNRAGSAQGTVISVNNNNGSVFCEGLWLDAGSFVTTENDALSFPTPAQGPYPDVYVQNCRITGVAGQFSGGHGDAITTFGGGVNNLYIDLCTIVSGYQGIFFSENFIKGAAYYSRINIDSAFPPGAGGFVYWLNNAPANPVSAFKPVYLNECYVTSSGGGGFLTNLVWPPTGTLDSGGVPVGALTDDGGASMYFPPAAKIHGRIKAGAPPGGDFVPAASVGLGYVSPGYQS